MASPVEQVFSATARSYDEDRGRLIPGFAEFYGGAVSLVPTDARDVLDLGAGTGLLSAFLRAHLPEARLHLVDLSGAMLAEARARFAEDARVTYQTGDYGQADLTSPYDAVVSALSIHHLTDEAKRGLLQRIVKLLRPGGMFVNAEQVLGPTPALEARYRQVWLDEVRALGASERQIRDSLLRQREDRCAPVEDQLVWMREAGFVEVDCWWKRGRFAVLAGCRPA